MYIATVPMGIPYVCDNDECFKPVELNQELITFIDIDTMSFGCF